MKTYYNVSAKTIVIIYIIDEKTIQFCGFFRLDYFLFCENI